MRLRRTQVIRGIAGGNSGAGSGLFTARLVATEWNDFTWEMRNLKVSARCHWQSGDAIRPVLLTWSRCARSMINSWSISPLRELHGESRAARDIVQPIIEAVSSWHPIVRSSGSVRT